MATQQNLNIIKITNPPIEDEVRTYLTSDVAAAATTLSTLDNTGFVLTGSNDYYILVGEYGFQKPEFLLVDASDAGTADTGFKTSACKYSHSSSDPVTFIRYNQINVYGAATSGGTKTLIEAIDIDPSEQFTTYSYDGTTYSYFYTTYYNVNDDEESAYSDEITSSSYTRKSIKRIIEAGLRKALTQLDRTQDSALNWQVAVEIVQDGIDEILTRKRTWPFLRTLKTDTTTTKDQTYIDKPADLSKLEFIIVNNQQLQLISRIDYNAYVYDNSLTTSGYPTTFMEKNNKYYIFPTPNNTYSIQYEYYKIPAVITTDLSTEIDFAFVPILIHYCAAHFAWIRGNDKRGDKMYKLFQDKLEEQVIEYTGPEQTGQAEYVERTSAYDYDVDISPNIYMG